MQEFGKDIKISMTQFLLLVDTVNYLFNIQLSLFLLNKTGFYLGYKVSIPMNLGLLLLIWMAPVLEGIFQMWWVGESVFGCHKDVGVLPVISWQRTGTLDIQLHGGKSCLLRTLLYSTKIFILM